MADLNIDALVADARRRIDGAFGAGAGLMTSKLFEKIGVQADPLAVSDGGRIYAVSPAVAGAAPRRVTGWLQAHVGFDRLAEGEWVFGVREGAPYAARLEEEMGHPFMGPLVRDNMDQLVRTVADEFRAGGR